MKLMLASLDCSPAQEIRDIWHYSKYILCSFYYVKNNAIEGLQEFINERNKQDCFILDSGAFSMFGGAKPTDLDEYVTAYINYINQYDIKRFVELDIGIKVPYSDVLKIRKRLERETGKKPIPVWHSYLDIEEYKKMVDDYDYIAIGGIVNREIPKSKFHIFNTLTAYAKKNGTKVHGLGFTGTGCEKYGFYSVDSSSWKSGVRYGNAVQFKRGKIQTIKKEAGTRANTSVVQRLNWIEWCKYQRHIDTRVKG